MNLFEVFLTQPILNLLIAFYKLLIAISFPWPLGFAIILLTLLIRLALWPLTSTQLKSAQKMTALKPHLERIKGTHGHDKVRHQQEVTKLYKEHGVNPLAGCLPLLLQIPIFIALYNVLLKIVQFNDSQFLEAVNQKLYFSVLHLAQIPNPIFLGLNLSAKPSEWQQVGLFILLIPILTGLFQFIQSKMLTAPLPNTKASSPKGDQGKESLEDTMASMQSQMTLIMPAMIAFFSYGFPVGLSLYWNTFTIIGIVQQYLIAGPGALGKYLPQSLRRGGT